MAAGPRLDPEQRELLAAVDAGAGPALELARWMAAHPELSLEEHATSERYRGVPRPGWASRSRAASRGCRPPSWRAAARPDAPLCAALLAEMDALPEIGHACGHNLSGPASLLAAERARAGAAGDAACACSWWAARPRRSASASGGSWRPGVFAEADVAMMAHASDMRRAHRLFLGNRKFEFVFHGRAAHAAAYPERGINALDAVIALFVNVGLLRQQLPARRACTAS